MTDIVFICECGKIYHFHKRFAGRSSRCINCRRDYVVPLITDQNAPPIGEESSIEDFVAQELSQGSDTSGIRADSTQGSASDASAGGDSTVSVMYSATNRRTETTSVLQQLGRYEVYEKIGSGGMGNVYYAWDTLLQRDVTIKATNQKGRRHKHYRERFINEARIAGKLVHSGIITIYSLDYDNTGEPYYAMRLLEGRTLEQLVAQYHNLSSPAHTPEQLRKLIRHFIDACQTIAYAHDNNVVHRDIKPANIMLGGYGETVVLDWGLAKTLVRNSDTPDSDTPDSDTPEGEDDEFDAAAVSAEAVSAEEVNPEDANEEQEEGKPDLTHIGARVGTTGYQSPEYLRGDDSQPSDDLYALGVTLYMILCNKLPYALAKDRRGLYEMMMVPPKPPHLVNSHVTKPLSAVCLCALAFDKEKRYPNAGHLATDLQRWLDGEPVLAYRMTAQEKILARLQRNAVLFFGMAVAFGLGFLLARWLFGG